MHTSIVDLIGNTPLMPLRRVVPAEHARVLIKLESTNPTGSMKDRAALAIVRRAAEDGRLEPGGTIVECTSGSTGTSLTSVAVALGYRCLLVSSDGTSSPTTTRRLASLSSRMAFHSQRSTTLPLTPI